MQIRRAREQLSQKMAKKRSKKGPFWPILHFFAKILKFSKFFSGALGFEAL